MKKIKSFLSEHSHHLLGNHGYNKFVIITSPRTGSNLLVSLLSSHKNINCYGEVFNHITNKNCKELWESTFKRKMPFIKSVGFKIFYEHPLSSEDKEVWNFIAKDKNIKIIHLVRDNVIRSQLSLLIAYRTNIWGLTPKMKDIPLEKRKVNVEMESFIRSIKQIDKNKELTKKRFQEHSYYEISYEKLTSGIQSEMNQLFDYLNVSRKKVGSNLRKQNPENLYDLIKEL